MCISEHIVCRDRGLNVLHRWHLYSECIVANLKEVRIRIRNTSLSLERKLVCYSCSFYNRDSERKKEEECVEWERQHLWISFFIMCFKSVHNETSGLLFITWCLHYPQCKFATWVTSLEPTYYNMRLPLEPQRALSYFFPQAVVRPKSCKHILIYTSGGVTL